ncbi:hypothetical protein [Mycoplasma sp. SG1]|uniref:hypothetical protein n=1 Tax=Mycoplasma sp. SG1 TaxID=2810348 RepID=UPI0020243CF4|nr:hypothetical protein [Mycoplasma sp. SG1]URM53105.1 hypothetical protein JRW51_02025 [Mycoplasma sp. SG1]
MPGIPITEIIKIVHIGLDQLVRSFHIGPEFDAAKAEYYYHKYAMDIVKEYNNAEWLTNYLSNHHELKYLNWLE